MQFRSKCVVTLKCFWQLLMLPPRTSLYPLLTSLLVYLHACVKCVHIFGHIRGWGGAHRGPKLMPGPFLSFYSLYSVKVSHWTWSTPTPATLASHLALGSHLCLLSIRMTGYWHAHACPFPQIQEILFLVLTLARKVFYPHSHLPNPSLGSEHTVCMLCIVCAVTPHNIIECHLKHFRSDSKLLYVNSSVFATPAKASSLIETWKAKTKYFPTNISWFVSIKSVYLQIASVRMLDCKNYCLSAWIWNFMKMF